VEEGFDAVAATDAEILLRRMLWLGIRGHALRAEMATAHRAAESEASLVAARDLHSRAEAAVARMRRRSVGPYPEGEAIEASVQAELAAIGGRPDPKLWAAGAEAWTDLGQTYEAAYARWREGAALLATRADRGGAEAALSQARSLAAELGAEQLRAEVEDLGRRARLNVTGPASLADRCETTTESPAEAVGLTKRESEVLGLVAEGKSNRQIAAALCMSEKTASVHVSRILTKLAVSSRGEAAALAHRLGLVEIGDP
jgi:DNA-binding CsgD family transcriptional regulator